MSLESRSPILMENDVTENQSRVEITSDTSDATFESIDALNARE